MMDTERYKVKFYRGGLSGREPVLEYIGKLDARSKAKVLKYIEFLREHGGYLDEPYSKHIVGKIRELRVDFARNRYRIFYFAFTGKKIILLHAFLKKTNKTPLSEIKKAVENYKDAVNNPNLYG